MISYLLIWIWVAVVVLVGCTSAQVHVAPGGERDRKPSSAGKELSILGDWSGVGYFSDSASASDIPLVCATLKGRAEPTNEHCLESGSEYVVQTICTDPNLSDGGKALFEQTTRVCQVIKDLSHQDGAGGPQVFFTQLKLQGPANSNPSGSTLDIQERESSRYRRVPIPGAKDIIEFSMVHSEFSSERSTNLEIHFFRRVAQ